MPSHSSIKDGRSRTAAENARLKTKQSEWRGRITQSKLLDKLIEHILNTDKKPVMTQSQVSAAINLLKKVLPDLTSSEVEQHQTVRNVVQATPMSEDDWAATYARPNIEGLADDEGDASPVPGPRDREPVH